MRKQKGFSLIELLIVVAIILIIAAIAIPNLLRARIAANESSAVGRFEPSIRPGCLQLRLSDRGLCGHPEQTGAEPAPAAPLTDFDHRLLDRFTVLGASNGTTKSGYTFVATGLTGSSSIHMETRSP